MRSGGVAPWAMLPARVSGGPPVSGIATESTATARMSCRLSAGSAASAVPMTFLSLQREPVGIDTCARGRHSPPHGRGAAFANHHPAASHDRKLTRGTVFFIARLEVYPSVQPELPGGPGAPLALGRRPGDREDREDGFPGLSEPEGLRKNGGAGRGSP